MVSNRDIGFVHVGQEVEIKVDTFNFTRYGLIHGSVLDLNTDEGVRLVNLNSFTTPLSSNGCS